MQKFDLKQKEILEAIDTIKADLPNGNTTEFKKHPKMAPYLQFALKNRDSDYLTPFLEDQGIPRAGKGKPKSVR